MRERGEADDAIRAFALAYERYAAGESATISSEELEPAGAGVRALEELADADPAVALEGLVQIKLNGGLATTMGLRSPKSLVRGARGTALPRHPDRPDAGAARAPRSARCRCC